MLINSDKGTYSKIKLAKLPNRAAEKTFVVEQLQINEN